MDQNALQQTIDRLKEANNVLVTVSANPSVDQLAACIGLTLLLNHLGKHGTAVFSGAVPSTIEFLKPDDTLEKNTDSLRDFIIALDKSKADKLRYKVEDKVVKIFITPYRTSLSEKDLEFSQGDFNVDAVMALGVHERTELDKAIMDHGRILHDATVISVNNKDQGNLGAINWVNVNASSMSEMVVELAHGLTKDALDGQMATALMTGIVAETDRFSNTKTSPRTMALASELMAAGANQQLIASKLSSPATATKASEVEDVEDVAIADDGSLQIAHEDTAKPAVEELDDLPSPSDSAPTSSEPPIIPPLTPLNDKSDQLTDDPPTGMPNRASMALEPPTMGGQLTANSVPEDQDEASTDPLSLPSVDTPSSQPQLLTRPASLDGTPIKPLEGLDNARDAVNDAIAAEPVSSQPLEPIASLGAQPVDLDLRGDSPAAPTAQPSLTPPEPLLPSQPVIPSAPIAPVAPPADPFGAPPDMNGINPNLPTNVPPSLLPPSQPVDATAGSGNPTAPPPVPPPMMPPTDAI